MDFSDYWSDVVWSIEMPSFDCLEDVYIIFIQQMRYKNSHNQHLTNWTRRNNRDKVWSSTTSLFKWRFRSRWRLCCLNCQFFHTLMSFHRKKGFVLSLLYYLYVFYCTKLLHYKRPWSSALCCVCTSYMVPFAFMTAKEMPCHFLSDWE